MFSKFHSFAWIAILLGCVGFFSTSTIKGDEIGTFADVEGFDDEAFEWEFNLGEVISIDSITVELSHSNTEELEVYLENIGTGLPYVLFTLIEGTNSGVGNTVGENDGDFGDLEGMSVLRFVEFGPLTTVRNAGDEAPSGDYLAEDWENNLGSGNPPYEPSRWRLSVIDNSGTGPGFGAIGELSINFTTAVPEPAGMAVACLAFMLVAGKRRRV